MSSRTRTPSDPRPWHLAADVAKRATCRRCQGAVTYRPGDNRQTNQPGDQRATGKYAVWRHEDGATNCTAHKGQGVIVEPGTLEWVVPTPPRHGRHSA